MNDRDPRRSVMPIPLARIKSAVAMNGDPAWKRPHWFTEDDVIDAACSLNPGRTREDITAHVRAELANILGQQSHVRRHFNDLCARLEGYDGPDAADDDCADEDNDREGDPA